MLPFRLHTESHVQSSPVAVVDGQYIMQDPSLVAAASRALPFVPQPKPLAAATALPVFHDGPGFPTAQAFHRAPSDVVSLSGAVEDDEEDIVNEAMRAASLAAAHDDDDEDIILYPSARGQELP